jgi:hypothetical protein
MPLVCVYAVNTNVQLEKRESATGVPKAGRQQSWGAYQQSQYEQQSHVVFRSPKERDVIDGKQSLTKKNVLPVTLTLRVDQE